MLTSLAGMENTKSNRRYIMLVVRGMFEELGFTLKHKGIDYYMYTLGNNYGSVLMDSVSVCCCVNGHVTYIYPDSWDEDYVDTLLDDIKAHLYGSEF